jgi:dihydroneopterin aldolase
MAEPKATAAPSARLAKVVITKVFVRGLEVEARIGVHAHEKGRRQPLIIDVELDVATDRWRSLSQTVDYETIADHARAIAGGRHIQVVESFAQRLATACLGDPRVLKARVRVEKPLALAPRAAAAGVEITAVRG